MSSLLSPVRSAKAYGLRLESVDVRVPAKLARTVLRRPASVGGRAFTFRFSEEDQSIQPYYHDRSFRSLVLPELLGGAQRVVELAQAYHRDFPAARTMGFNQTWAGILPSDVQQLVQGRRPAVLVADSEPYASDLGAVTAVYVWTQAPAHGSSSIAGRCRSAARDRDERQSSACGERV